MARVSKRICDITGNTASETIKFSVRGRTYEIDLAKQQVAAFDRALQKYIEAGRDVTERKGQQYVPSEKVWRLREWAKENGFPLGQRGTIPKRVEEAYDEAMKNETATEA